MTFPVLVEKCDGQFSATLVGVPGVRAMEPSRSQALAGLRAEIEKRIELGRLTSLEIDPVGVSALAGTYSDDPTLREISDGAYQMRNADRGQ